MTNSGKVAALDSCDRDTLGYLSAFPQIGDAIRRRVEQALIRGAELEARAQAAEAKVARVEALMSDGVWLNPDTGRGFVGYEDLSAALDAP